MDSTNGVADAQRESMLSIAPGLVEGEFQVQPQMVHFETAITVNAEAGGGISVCSLGELKAAGSSETTNKLTFDVPVYFQAPTERHEKWMHRVRAKKDTAR